jgi:cytochrome P450
MPQKQVAREPTSGVNLLSQQAIDAPHEVFTQLRDAGPIVWLPEHQAWFISTYDGVSEAFRDPLLSSDRLTPLERRHDDDRRQTLAQTFELLRGWMVFHDPPEHERLREPLKRAFTPKRVAGLRPRIAEIVGDLLDDMARKESCDIISDFAFPLPAIVIAELLGVPPEDRADFRHWSDQLAGIVFGASNRPDQAEQAAAGSAQFADYFGWLIRKYEQEPADNLVSDLIAVTRIDPQGSGLSPTELVGACTLLLFGGHETTTNLIGNSTHSLLTNPSEFARLAERPEQVPQVLEELHRYDGSTKLMVRIVGKPHERHGVPLEPGQTVFLGVASANRDPAMFDDPDRLWLERPDAQRHLGFGYGIHFCLGASLARLEAQIAVEALVRRFPQMVRGNGDLEWSGVLLGRGLKSFPVDVNP